jgi:hypothetical protein
MDAGAKPGMDGLTVSTVDLGEGLGLGFGPLNQFGVGLH